MTPQTLSYVDQWERAFQILRDAGIIKKNIRSYVLIGFKEGPQEAWDRCEYITGRGIKALPQWFHALDAIEKNTVSTEQARMGWVHTERALIMQYYYQRGKHRAKIQKLGRLKTHYNVKGQ